MKLTLVSTVLFLLCFALGCKPDQPAVAHKKVAIKASPPKMKTTKVKAPKRIILLIGDGMGLPVVTASAYANGELNMLKMPVVSFMRTHEFEYLTTDSAASATAFATGAKSHFEAVSVKPGITKEQEQDKHNHLTHMVEVAQKAKWRTGLIATSRIVHATPAAFAAHRSNRKSYEDIALDMSQSGVDVLLGAGSKYFAKRKDKINLFDTMKTKGYAVATTPEEIVSAASGDRTKKLVGLLYDKDMPPLKKEARKMPLANMVDQAIKVLDRDNDTGFFLMVEGSQIDWEEHALNGPAAIKETIDFDRAVGRALAYANKRDDTLVIVTADHETGGFAVLDQNAAGLSLRTLSNGELSAANELVAKTFKGKTTPEPDAVEKVELKANSAFMPSETTSNHLLTTFGFLSLASRTYWQKPSTFIAAHTNTMVPLFAQGAGAELVRSIADNADLGNLIQLLIKNSASQVDQTQETFEQKTPTNVILLVGDGMGLAPVTAAFYAQGDLAMLGATYKGFVATHATNQVVNDSAATATALAIGQRTRYGTVGMYPKSGQLVSGVSVLEAAERRGKRTGLVTNTTLTHATPAAFYAHQPNRRDERKIAADFVSLASRVNSDGIDVAYGGGRKFFDKAMLADLKKQGMHIETTWSKTDTAPGHRRLGLFASGGLPTAKSRIKAPNTSPSLAQMTERALTHLAPAPRGFFLMVEGGQIDWAQHALNKGDVLLPELLEFDQAVAVAMKYAKTHGNTLVIVTADHDHTMSLLDNHYAFHKGWCGVAKRCGGPFTFEPVALPSINTAHREGFSSTALQGKFGRPELMIQYGWLPQAAALKKRSPGPHSAHFVPLMAYGPGARAYSGFQHQPQVGARLVQWALGQK